MMEKYLVDLFVASAQEQMRAPKALLRLYLSLFSPPLGKTLRLDMVKDMLTGQDLHALLANGILRDYAFWRLTSQSLTR